MPTHEDELIRRARELQRLVTKRRRLKRQLRTVESEIKHARKMLNAVKQASEGRRPDAAPDRLNAGTVAIGVAHPHGAEPEPARAVSVETDAFIESLEPVERDS